MDCVHVRTTSLSTHNLCFKRAQKREKIITQVYDIKVGCKGVLITRTCFPDGFLNIPCFLRFFMDFNTVALFLLFN